MPPSIHINSPRYDRLDRRYILWCDIQDIIGNASAWPYAIRLFFWSKNLKHWNRVRVASFAYVNGLHPDILLEWGELVGMWGGPYSASYRHVLRLLNYFQAGIQYKLWAYNVSVGEYQWLNGTRKEYSGSRGKTGNECA